jgi:small subunit ribosomal protein S4
MARYTGPACRLCRTEQKRLFLKGDRCKSDKCPINRKRPLPGKDPKARIGKRSEYGLQLREKQKLKRIYGMLEKQFRLFFDRALRMPGITGDNLLALLESRLDNVVFRMHFAVSRSQARQFVQHGHVTVNGKRVDIPSYTVKAGDIVQIQESSRKMSVVMDALKEVSKSGNVPWITINVDEQRGTFDSIPRRSDVTDLTDIKEQLVVELYSK